MNLIIQEIIMIDGVKRNFGQNNWKNNQNQRKIVFFCKNGMNEKNKGKMKKILPFVKLKFGPPTIVC